MKGIISLLLAMGVLCMAGCQKSSETNENSSDTNIVVTPTNSLESEMKTNVVAPVTNGYMSTTNSLMGTNR